MFGDKQESIHSAYFEAKGTVDLMRLLLRGIDRTIVTRAMASAAPP
jgi:hypothetical protein